MSLSAGEIVRLLKSDRDALRELAVAVASEPELRLAVINAVLADVATKQDIQQMRQELRGEIAQLRQHVDSEISQLRQEIAQLRRGDEHELQVDGRPHIRYMGDDGNPAPDENGWNNLAAKNLNSVLIFIKPVAGAG
jgi:transcriptional regulator of heat shock response